MVPPTMIDVDNITALKHGVGILWLTIEAIALPVSIWLLWHCKCTTPLALRTIEAALMVMVGRLLFTLFIIVWEIAGAPINWIDATVLAHGLSAIPVVLFLIVPIISEQSWPAIRWGVGCAMGLVAVLVVLRVVVL